MYSAYKDGLTELFRILIQTVVLQALRQAFENRNRNVLIIDLSAMQLTDNSALKALIGVVEQVEGPQLAIFFVGAPNGLLSLLQHDVNKEKLSRVCLVKSIQDITTEDIIKLTENKVDEKEGSVVTTPTLPAPTSVQATGVTPNYVPQMGYPTGVPGQPTFGSA
jgi:ABC-type transporter Mla MlaB component